MAKKKKNQSKRVEREQSLARDADTKSYRSPNQLVDLGVGSVVIGLLTAAPFVSEGSAEQFQNWILFFLWLVVLAVVVARQLLTKEFRLQFGQVDLCFYAVCLWICLSGIVCLYNESGHARPTINSTWQWFGYAVAFFSIRQLSSNQTFRISAWSALFLLAVGISVSGIYQRYIVYPAVWQNYQELTEDQKQNSMRSGGLSNVAKGSRERVMWENRLRATEPTSTFVLANSLAAYLTPWLVVAVGIAIPAFYNKSTNTLLTVAISFMPMAGCLVLTKSRTSYLAAAIGVAVAIFFLYRMRKRSIPWKLVIGIILVVAIGASVAFLTGVVDKQVVTEAFKSLSYRIEYWQASFNMIMDHLFFGVGPGNFQHSYAKYQLVQASETVSDPHNFLIEVCAVGGIPAALFFVVGIVLWFRGLLKNEAPSEEVISSSKAKEPDLTVDQFQATIGLAFGSGLACFVGLLNGADMSLVAMGGLVAVLLALATLYLQKELVNEKVASIAIISLGIALCASGGVGFPSVAMTGIFMLAINLGATDTSDNKRSGSWIFMTLLIASVVAVFLFRATVFDPIRNANQHAQVGQVEAMNGQLEPAIDRLELAIKADPYDGNFLFFKLQLLSRRFQMNPTLETLEEMADIAQKSATARPNNSKVTLESGKIFLAILISNAELRQNIKSQAEKTAVELFDMSTSRRPNDALHASYRAFAYKILGEDELAKEWAARAMDLDEQNPHQDKDLKNVPFRLDGYRSEQSIEQELENIRRN